MIENNDSKLQSPISKPKEIVQKTGTFCADKVQDAYHKLMFLSVRL